MCAMVCSFVTFDVCCLCLLLVDQLGRSFDRVWYLFLCVDRVCGVFDFVWHFCVLCVFLFLVISLGMCCLSDVFASLEFQMFYLYLIGYARNSMFSLCPFLSACLHSVCTQLCGHVCPKGVHMCASCYCVLVCLRLCFHMFDKLSVSNVLCGGFNLPAGFGFRVTLGERGTHWSTKCLWHAAP